MKLCTDLLSYCILLSSVTIVNKYVLTELGFRYPTIFQGWQTFAGASILYGLQKYNLVDLELGKWNRIIMLQWLPYFLAYICGIYSASVALSNMSIAIFLSFQSLSAMLNLVMYRIVLNTKVLSAREYIGCSVVLVSLLFVSQTDDDTPRRSYVWMWVHVLATVFQTMFHQRRKSQLNVGDLSLLFVCYSVSVLAFLPCMLLLGDAAASVNFPFWTHRLFYSGAVLSGVLGVTLHYVIYTKSLKQSAFRLFDQSVSYAAIAKLSAACFSLVVFPPSVNHFHNLAWCLCNLLFCSLLNDVNGVSDIKVSLSDPDFTTPPADIPSQDV